MVNHKKTGDTPAHDLIQHFILIGMISAVERGREYETAGQVGAKLGTRCEQGFPQFFSLLVDTFCTYSTMFN